MAQQAIGELQKDKLVALGSSGRLSLTEYGEIMSRVS